LDINNQILLSGFSPEQLIELFRPMVREELRLVIAEQDKNFYRQLRPAKFLYQLLPKPLYPLG